MSDEANEISGMRKVYRRGSLSENDVDNNPIHQFEKWWQQAVDSKADEPNAMTLATCTSQGRPSARIVLLKEIKNNGFVFFTNYDSRKGHELAANAYAALVFFWKELERQVRIEGKVKKIAPRESDAYFAIRPRESQIGAWSSPQSARIPDAGFLQKNVQKFTQQFQGKEVSRPSYWGGYILIPERVEFWQGRPGRLHDRILYTNTQDGKWNTERLAP